MRCSYSWVIYALTSDFIHFIIYSTHHCLLKPSNLLTIRDSPGTMKMKKHKYKVLHLNHHDKHNTTGDSTNSKDVKFDIQLCHTPILSTQRTHVHPKRYTPAQSTTNTPMPIKPNLWMTAPDLTHPHKYQKNQLHQWPPNPTQVV